MENPEKWLTIKRRIAFSDTDAAGLVHFSTYFKLMEEAEAKLFRSLGIPLLASDADGLAGYPRVDCNCRFRRPLRFDDPVVIQLSITSIRATRITYAFVFRSESGEICAEGNMVTTYVCGKHGGALSASSLPDSVRETLEEWKNSHC